MKNLLFITIPLFALLTPSNKGEAKGISQDNIVYEVLNEEEQTATVFGYENNPRNATIAETVSIDGENYTVTAISDYAFQECGSLLSVKLPSTVKKIGFGAFAYCSSLNNINIPEGVESIENSCFGNCTSLQEIVLPESLTIISGNAFTHCTSLEKVSFPQNLQTIDMFAFFECSNLKDAKIGSKTTEIGYYSFGSCSSLENFEIDPENPRYESINGVLFDKTSHILLQYPLGNPRVEYSIPQGTLQINEGAFVEAKKLKIVVIPDGLTYIGDAAFNSCISLESIKLGNTIARIGGGSFAHCTSLKSFTIPASLTDIAEQAFFNNPSLEEFIVDGNNTEYSSLDGVLCNKNQTLIINYPAGNSRTYYAFPKTINAVHDHAFRGADLLEEVSVSEGVIKLNEAAFYECKKLKKAHLPESLTELSHYVFFGCSSLETITIPINVESFGAETFYGCSSLIKVYALPEIPPYAGDNTFTGVPQEATLYVPKGSENLYREECGWNYFKNILNLESGVETINFNEKTFEVYTLDGNCLSRSADPMFISTLPHGVYIINGRKILK